MVWIRQPKIDRETGKVISVWGEDSPEQMERLLKQIATMLQQAYLQYLQAILSYASVHPGQVKLINNELILEGTIDIDTEQGKALQKIIGTNTEVVSSGLFNNLNLSITYRF